jgi:hypothetical protein
LCYEIIFIDFQNQTLARRKRRRRSDLGAGFGHVNDQNGDALIVMDDFADLQVCTPAKGSSFEIV